MGTSLEERIGYVESRYEIDRLVSDYCHGCDKHDIDRFMSIWHSDATWLIGPPYGNFTGAAEIKHALEDLIWTALPETHHWTTNHVIEFQGPDHATGVCDVSCDGFTPEGQMLLIAATYWDTFERRAGEWRIAERKVDLFYFKPAVLVAADGTPTVEA